MKGKKAIIFDMDGVLINTESILKQDEFLFLNNLTQKKWTRKDQTSIQGLSLEGVYELLVYKYQFKSPKNVFLKKYYLLLESIYKEKIRLNPFVLKMLNHIKSRRYELALCSSAPRKFIRIALQRFALNKYFKVVVSADDLMGKSKPEPDIFLYTARRLGISSSDCLVIEDSLNGIRAAKKAGMLCIAYCPLKGISSNLADYTIYNFKEFMEINLNSLYNKCSQVEIVNIYGQKIYLFLSDQVNKSDYYSDLLLSCLIKQTSKIKYKHLKLLEIGTGRGYLSIMLAKLFANIDLITATDIDTNALQLAYKNILLNSLEDRINLKKGNLFEPIRKQDRFDIIFSAPPQMPFTREEIVKLGNKIIAYHLTASVGGEDGQKIISQLINNVTPHIRPNGFLAFVQADFSNPKKAIELIGRVGLKPCLVKRKRKLLKETTLTKMLRSTIEQKGYRFNKNIRAEEYFQLLTIIAHKK